MKRFVGGMATVALVLGLTASTATAQIFNQPVYFSPAHGTGVTVAGDFGYGVNEDAELTSGEKPWAAGGRIILGTQFVQLSGGASYVVPRGGADKEVAFGGSVALNLFRSTATTPVAVNVQVGVGYLKQGNNTLLDFPIGIGIAADVSTPGVSVEPWAAPRVHIQRVSNGTSDTEVGFGVSGGLNVNLPIGIGLHAAADWMTIGDPSSQPLRVGGGIHLKFSVPSLGVPGGVLGG